MRRVSWALALLVLSACASSPKQRISIPIKPPTQSIDQLLDELGGSNATSRAAAAWSLAGAGSVDAKVVQALLVALDDASASVREAAIWALGHVKGPGLNAGELFDSPPKPLVMTRPKYPAAAFHKKIEGTVMLDILIGESGSVVHAEVRISIPGLDDAALECVRGWQFEPARQKGRPVATTAQAPVSFRIFEDGRAAEPSRLPHPGTRD